MLNKTNIIYRIYNTKNNKSYIGKSHDSFNIRYRNGIQNTHNKDLKDDIKLYGKESFEIEILHYDVTDEKELDRLEEEYIKKYDSINNGYNIIIGQGGDIFNQLPLERQNEIRKKFSENAKGKNNPMYNRSWKEFLTDEEIKQHNKNVSLGNYKRYENPLEREKTSKTSKEMWNRPGFKEKMSKMRIGENNPRSIKCVAISPNGDTYSSSTISGLAKEIGFKESVIGKKIRNNDTSPYKISNKTTYDRELCIKFEGWIFKKI